MSSRIEESPISIEPIMRCDEYGEPKMFGVCYIGSAEALCSIGVAALSWLPSGRRPVAYGTSFRDNLDDLFVPVYFWHLKRRGKEFELRIDLDTKLHDQANLVAKKTK